ncbi:hypothetical protein [Streptomyces stelliscabiei]|uniref:Uncharacterized protein n=1 Tax=Streptomyces stelliscabiei TaxID=146820 RepID=A0A8I0TPT0_9ACTN|nr:hypothetical protein [Streptomyces stelliscabiei]KND45305.1 hypothetical protein IQ64_07700 [Streptomyces stelliscabiei]MBE1597140.1 hypothetical protein [Streptomyces stelliscabiei]
MTETTAPIPLDADGEELVDSAEYIDRHGDTWRYLGGIEELRHVKRADEDTPDPNCGRWCEDATAVARDFGPMTKVTEATR